MYVLCPVKVSGKGAFGTVTLQIFPETQARYDLSHENAASAAKQNGRPVYVQEDSGPTVVPTRLSRPAFSRIICQQKLCWKNTGLWFVTM
jgi:hypothetical protein